MKKFFLSFVIVFGLLTWAESQPFSSNIQPIPPSIQHKMTGVSWRAHCPIGLNQLAYVQVSYWGFDHKTHEGVLILNKTLAPQSVKLFKQLYLQHFPIHQMQPMYKFKGNDLASMTANNTSGFNCRYINNSKNRFSKHAYGRAIDINPRMNPFIKGKRVLPPNAKAYVNRLTIRPGMITKGDKTYKAFTQQGWRWGGNWRYSKDYQHFEK